MFPDKLKTQQQMSTTQVAPKAAQGAVKVTDSKAKKQTPKVRTTEELKSMGLVGNLIIVVKKAQALSASHDYEGTEVKDAQYPGNAFYRLTKRGGTIEKVDQKSAEWKEFHAAAKLAVPDLKEMKYSKTVKDFIKAALNLTPEVAPRGLNMSVLDDIKL